MIIKKISLKQEHKTFLIILFGILLIFGIRFILADLTHTYENIFERTETIEVWANTSIEIEDYENYIRAYLKLDNSSYLSNLELILYVDDLIFNRSFTNSEGFVDFELNLEHFNSETEGSLIFEGDSSLYLNPSSEKFKLSNFSKEVLNETNQTVENVSLSGCIEFTERVLWNSGHSYDEEGSIEYYAWYINNTCEKLNIENCVLKNIQINSRFVYITPPDTDFQGQGYVQISEPDENICDDPKKGNYVDYLAFETLNEDEIKQNKKYCNKNSNDDCVKEIFNVYDKVSCYGIKTYASQYSMVDVFEISYSICSKEEIKNV